MAGPIPFGGGIFAQADYKDRRALKSCHSEFHRILWCGIYKTGVLILGGEHAGHFYCHKPVVRS